MSTIWTDAEKRAHWANRDKNRVIQSAGPVKDDAMIQMALVGPRALLKIFPVGVDDKRESGYFGTSVGMFGKSPLGIAKLLGLKPAEYANGADIYRLKRLPTKDEFEVRGYTHFPDGVALPAGKRADPDGYPPGTGALQWELVQPVQMEFVCSLGPGEVLTQEKLNRILNLSGAAWWHTNAGKYPNIDKISALRPVFADKVQKFVTALRKAGADIDISETRRNPVRARLMHYSYKLARGEIKAKQLPTFDDCDIFCDIVWDHGNEGVSRADAREMAELYKIDHEPSLTSPHIPGHAIAMKIKWSMPITIIDGHGCEVRIAGPGNGASSAALHKVGASFGVMKLLKDPQHWSINGH